MNLTRRSNPLNVLKNVVISGGTHGNELSGIYMIQHFRRNANALARPSFKASPFLSNEAAIKADRRYVDVDMNRCFLIDDLEKWKKLGSDSNDSLNVEQCRAVEIDNALGPKSSMNPKSDFIFDLHNTTANTGKLLCFHEEDGFALEVAAFLKSVDPNITAVHWPSGDVPFLPSIARSGMTVEVGPVAHSTFKTPIYNETKALIANALDYIDLHNEYIAAGNEQKQFYKKVKVDLPMAVRLNHVSYPRDNSGNITAFIHESLLGIPELQEGSNIVSGAPIFQTLGGETVHFNPKDYSISSEDIEAGIFPMFVNEAAYYEKDVAFYLTKRVYKTVEYLVKTDSSSL
eukprot:CAMPEP_0184022352 /NCGR_PEP_ID=MMETSP0954-20121128/10555_1 /TAXON_ID=627963 /ORGANISM="Aplanochytrium sp, Strain PBS07" /LENGTH=344 /DNA_ID=CAMNT_0026304711 /DNA_START=147 /DNA_END=1181 /DNA_ORIENTATION=+